MQRPPDFIASPCRKIDVRRTGQQIKKPPGSLTGQTFPLRHQPDDDSRARHATALRGPVDNVFYGPRAWDQVIPPAGT